MSRRERFSTSARVSLTVTAVLTIGVIALSAVSYFAVVGRLRAELDRGLLREAQGFASAVARAEHDDKDDDLRSLSRAYLQTRTAAYSASNPILLVRLSGGGVLTNSSVRLDQAPVDVKALDPARAQRAFLDVVYKGASYRAAVVPVRDASGTVTAVFQAALPLEATKGLANSLLLTLSGAGGVVVMIGAMLSLFAARASLRPLRRAAATADRITQAHLAERIAYNGPNDSVGHLVAAVNGMLDRLEEGFGEQRRFLADASHELRTPLAIIAGNLELLRDDDAVASAHDEELAVLTDEVERMGRLVDDMLGLARLEAGPVRPFQLLDARVLLLEAAGRGRTLGRRGFRVEAPEGLWVQGDPDQLLQALLNLVNNAVSHTAEDGTIRLTAARSGSRVALAVEDDGVGLRQDEIPRLFDRFYRSRGERRTDGGSGLGLAIVRRLVELHGGTVSAAARPQGGSMFTITLPRAEAPRS